MNRNYKTSSLTEAAMITGILVVIAFISNFLFTFLMFFYPTPAIILAKRKGVNYAAMALIASGLIISILLGFQTGLMYLLLYTPISIALCYGVYKDYKPNKTILISSAAYMISFVILIFLLQLIMNVNILQQIVDIYKESFDLYGEMLQKAPAGANIEKSIEMVDQLSKNMITTLSQMFPAIIIFSSVLTSIVNYMVACKFARRFSIEIIELESFSFFSFPRSFIVGMAVLLLLSYLVGIFNINVQVIQLNLFMITFMAMTIQGMSVLNYFLIKWNVKRLGRVLIMIIAFANPGTSRLISIAGVVDLGMDFRKIRQNN